MPQSPEYQYTLSHIDEVIQEEYGEVANPRDLPAIGRLMTWLRSRESLDQMGEVSMPVGGELVNIDDILTGEEEDEEYQREDD